MRMTQADFKALVKSKKLFKFASIGCPNRNIYNKVKENALKRLEQKTDFDDPIVKWENIVHLKNTEIRSYNVFKDVQVDEFWKITNPLTMVLIWFKDTKILGIYYYQTKHKFTL